MKELELIVKGRVQGVNFRQEVKRFALDKNLKGFVENLEDGSVRIVLQGRKELINEFVFWIKKGPGISFVEDVNLIWRDISEEHDSFFIKKKNNFFIDKLDSLKNLFKLNKKIMKVPSHVAIIPDGNRRWARKLGLIDTEGHKKATEFNSVFSLFKEARKLGIKYISIWGFSTENWKRSEDEKKYLFDLILGVIKEFRKEFEKEKIRFRHLGRKDRLPKELVSEMKKLEKETEKYSEFNVNLCLDYGGRDEILRAVEKIVREKKKINEENFENCLDTKDIPNLDLIIRTSGEKRTSGLMPFQGVYAELYFYKKYFPDFKPKDLREAVLEFGRRKRRFGGG